MSLVVVGSVAIDNVETPNERRDNLLAGPPRIFPMRLVSSPVFI